MTTKSVFLAGPLLIALALGGCAQSQLTPTAADPSTEAAAPQTKPTAAHPEGPRCFDDAGVTAEQEHRGGTVTWPEPLTDSRIPVEPSCWVDTLDQDRAIFLASWYGLDEEQIGTLNQAVEGALVDAGYHTTLDSDGVAIYELEGVGAHPGLIFNLNSAGGGYTLQVDPAQP